MIKTQIGCNVHQVPELVNLKFRGQRIDIARVLTTNAYENRKYAAACQQRGVDI